MKVIKTEMQGLFIIDPKSSGDKRGIFTKTYNKDFFTEAGLDFSLAENYYSISKKDVIRGMHFQTKPYDHIKIVYVTHGKITDVILDIRKGSATYGKYLKLEISETNRLIVYIPSGFAHGFLSQADDTCVVYLQSSVYSKDHDCGVKYDSFGMKWDIQNPIVSDRDLSFPTFDKFKSPFGVII